MKSASIQSYSAAGTPVTYTYQVTNNGDVALTNVMVTDPMTGLSAIDCGGGTNVIASLAVGAKQSCTASYTTTAQDVANGSITNVGTATGTTPGGSAVSYNSSLTIPATGQPFTCNTPPEPDFLSQASTASGPTQLYDSTTAGNSVSYQPLGPSYSSPHPKHAYNALGFDTATGYLYAMLSGTGTLLRIDSAGDVTPAGTVSGYPVTANAPLAGAFDDSGDYWVTAGGGSTTAYEIDVTSSPPQVIGTVTLSAPFNPYDWSWDGGYLWGLAVTTIYRVSIATGVVSTFHAPIPRPPGTRAYGAAWTFGNGNLGFSNNKASAPNPNIYQVSVTNPSATNPVFTLVSSYSGPGSVAINDGAACVGQPTDLSVVKTGPATVPVGGTITWEMTVTNNGPGNSSGFALDDTVPAGVTGVTALTPGCVVTGNDVQCSEGPLDNGDSATITLTGTAPGTASTCVVNTATVTANETDPDSGNNSSSVQTCTDPGFPSVGLVKSASIQSYSAAGTPVTYTYQVSNTGDVTLTNVTVTDPMTGLSAIDCGGGSNVIASLAPGASATCTASYTTTAQDLTNGSITNTGTATGTTPTGASVSYSSTLTIPAVGTAFTCTIPTNYLSQGIPTTLYYETGGAGSGTYTQLGPTSSLPDGYNALGFDTHDRYLYAVEDDSGNTLLRIDSSGNVTALGSIGGSISNAYIGGFDPEGHLWISNGGGVAEEVAVPSARVIKTVNLSQSFVSADWAWDGGFWGLNGQTMYRMDPTTGAVDTFAAPSGVPAGGGYGAAWTYSNGNLGFSDNATGEIEQISVTNPSSASPRFALVSSVAGPPAAQNNNDGTSCVGAHTDLSIVKTGPATVVAGGAITWALTVTDNGPGNSSGFAVTDDVPAGVSHVSTSTPGCTVTGRDVRCAEGTLGDGDSFVVTVSGTAPAAAGTCVTNTATVTANEHDPNRGNNTSSVQTCT